MIVRLTLDLMCHLQVSLHVSIESVFHVEKELELKYPISEFGKITCLHCSDCVVIQIEPNYQSLVTQLMSSKKNKARTYFTYFGPTENLVSDPNSRRCLLLGVQGVKHARGDKDVTIEGGLQCSGTCERVFGSNHWFR